MVGEPEFNLEGFGILKLISGNNGSEWFGDVQSISAYNTVELSIEVERDAIPSPEQLEFLKTFTQNIEVREQVIFDHICKRLEGTKGQLTQESLKRIYSLSAVALKRNSADVWVTLEPQLDAPTPYNFLPRLTLRKDEVVWSNLA